MSDESTKCKISTDLHIALEIRYELLPRNYEVSTHIPAQTTPIYAAPILKSRSQLSQKSRGLQFKTHVLSTMTRPGNSAIFSDSSQPQVVEGSQGTGKEQREQP